MLDRDQKAELRHLCRYGSEKQLKEAVDVVEKQLRVAYSDELHDLRYIRNQLLEELDARAVTSTLRSIRSLAPGLPRR